MKKLTQREKFLIYILICFVIASGGLYFVVLPSYQKYSTLSDQVSEAAFTQDSMASAIDSMPAGMKTRDEANIKLAALKSPFSAHLPNEGLDIVLTQLCLDNNLTPETLSIDANVLQGVSTFVAPALSVGTTSSAAAGTESTTASATTESTTNTSGPSAWNGVVSMKLTGTQTDFYRLMDAVDARPDMIISSFDMAPATSTQSTGATTTGTTTTSTTNTGFSAGLDGGNVTITVTFTVYMVDK